MDSTPTCLNCKHIVGLRDRVDGCQFKCITKEVRSGLIVGYGKVVEQEDGSMLVSDPNNVICSVHEHNV